jgi:hypothetical protein
MGERDAFGREKNEDTLSEMGWRSGLGAGNPLDAGEAQRPFAKPKPTQPPPLEARAAVDPLAPAPLPPVRPATVSVGGQEQLQEMVAAVSARRDRLVQGPPAAAAPRAPARAPRRGGPSIARLLISLCLLAIVGVGAFEAIAAGRSAVGDIKDKIDDTVKSGQAAITPPTATSGTRGGSYLKAGNLKAALAHLPAGRLVSPLRVDNASVDAQVVKGSSSHVVVLRTDGTKFDTKVPLSGLHQKTLHVNAAAPARIVKALHRKPSQVNYMVLLDDHWVVFLENGRHYQASTAGTHVTRIG